MRDMLETGPAGGDVFRLQGRHVLASLVAFFGIVFAVNGFMLVRALSTHSGVVAIEPYRKGLAYKERIQADEVQTSLGWRDAVHISAPNALSVVLSDRDGASVTSMHVRVLIGRPATNTADRTLELREVGPGQYAAEMKALEPGTWIVDLEVRHGRDAATPVYRAKRRLWLKP
jgi:nitrogen fixation protein FixH